MAVDTIYIVVSDEIAVVLDHTSVPMPRDTKLMSVTEVNAAGGTDGTPIAASFNGDRTYINVYQD